MKPRWRSTSGRAACLVAAVALAGCARPPDIRVGAFPSASPSASPSPRETSPPTPSAAPPAAEPSLDYSSYYACSATVRKPTLPSTERQTIHVRSNLPSAQVTVTATYGRVKQPVTATTDAQGRADIIFKTLPNIRSGTPVQVAIVVAPSTHCSTSFSIG
jgi:hypothetical protein